MKFALKSRPAFTLFELILAIALSATLLGLIGTAVNLYLIRMDSSRTRVEEAQLARSILSTIAADIRATTVYQTQDISSVEQLAAASAVFDPDAIDAAGEFDASALGDVGAAAGVGGAAGGSAGAGAAGDSATGGISTESSQTSSITMAPGLNGLVKELTLDVARLPRLDELFPPVPQQASSLATASAVANQPRPSDLKSVRYFLRQGTTIDASDQAVTALSPAAQLAVGGLVRQTVDRAIREVAEQSANAQLLNSGQVLLAPEVTDVQFIYFDGTTAVNQWDMQQMGSLPTAVDVRIWIAPDPIDAAASEIPLQPRMYSQTIELPLAQAAGAAASGAQQQATDGTATDDATAGAAAGEQGTGGVGDEGAGF